MAKPKGKLPKGYYKITFYQLSCIANAGDNLSAMVGTGGGSDDDFKKTVKGIDRFLKANNLKRAYN